MSMIGAMGPSTLRGMSPLLFVADVRDLARVEDRKFNDVSQFVKDWNRDPSRRMLMIETGPTDGSVEHRTAMAALVRCLCARDHVRLPGWVREFPPLLEPYALSGAPVTEFVRRYTPGLAAGLGVYFDRALLDRR